MATVTGLTADRMIEMENATVIDGNVVGTDLILVTRGGTEINVGFVQGPQGVQGPEGPPIPPGALMPYAGVAAPTGWLCGWSSRFKGYIRNSIYLFLLCMVLAMGLVLLIFLI